ncbi:CASP-like protein 5B3 [Zingiber officinale]|uniref:CASP-like protein n=1 Tax=Zingiber officinale TaxID=94328 RepID=A0A8J5FXV1_ZINOF|nr:CASP-like protein 5B3 [Zingiber officinale]KAG6494197.1 hypothetical protein ZIOFF_049216 [Zingiber officinale]
MKVVFGSPGTRSGLLLRTGQIAFAAVSIAFMISAFGFSNYTAFCYLVASMGLQALWSLGLACLDIYAIKVKRDLHNHLLVSLFIVGDWVTATLSLAAACSSAGVTVLFVKDTNFCKSYSQFSCGKFQVSTAMAFISWMFVSASALVMFWILTSS